MENELGDIRRKAYRTALIRLAEAWPQPYKQFREGVKLQHPEFSSWQTTSTARQLLREAFDHRFQPMYEEEKAKLGLSPTAFRGRDWEATADEIVRLYDGGNGLTVKQIRDKLQCGTEFVGQSLRNAGITPKKGRRK